MTEPASIVPRFEFRAFARSFEAIAERVRREALSEEVSESTETYLLAPNIEDHNVKARGGRLEIKRRVDRRGMLERWKPVAEAELPVGAGFVEHELLPALGLRGAHLAHSSYSLADVFDVSPELRSAEVFKRRHRFDVDGCPTELDELTVEGVPVQSAAVEGEDPDAVLAVVRKLGMSAYENVNYPLAIRRMIGFEGPSEKTDG